MCLLKKIISPPDHRVNKKPRTPPSDNLLQRGYLEGIGWSPMAMLLEAANGSIMVRHVLYVCEDALPSNILFLCWVYFLLLTTNIVKIKCYVCCKRCKRNDCTFFPVVIFLVIVSVCILTRIPTWPDDCTFFSGCNFFRWYSNQRPQTTGPFFFRS